MYNYSTRLEKQLVWLLEGELLLFLLDFSLAGLLKAQVRGMLIASSKEKSKKNKQHSRRDF